MSLEQIAKFVKAGNVEQLEIAVLLGKGKHILGKATWNDAARNYIKSVPSYIEDVNEMFKHATDGDLTKFVEILKKNKKYLFARDSQGRTPLHVAAQNGHAAVVKKVLSENAEYTQITDPVSILWCCFTVLYMAPFHKAKIFETVLLVATPWPDRFE